MSNNKLWNNEPEKTYKHPRVVEAEKLFADLSSWVCPPPIYNLLKLLIEDMKERTGSI